LINGCILRTEGSHDREKQELDIPELKKTKLPAELLQGALSDPFIADGHPPIQGE